MRLKDYLDAEGLSIYKFSKRAGLSRQALTRFLGSESSINMNTAYRVQRASKGKVTLDELILPEDKAKIDKEVK